MILIIVIFLSLAYRLIGALILSSCLSTGWRPWGRVLSRSL